MNRYLQTFAVLTTTTVLACVGARDDDRSGGVAPLGVAGPGLRMPAEYEPTESVLISYQVDADPGDVATFGKILDQIAVHVAAAGARVVALKGPAAIAGVPAQKYSPLADVDVTGVWTRDYGPVSVFEPGGALRIVDPIYPSRPGTADDRVPCALAAKWGVACQATKLALDGGNLMSDGAGTVFATKRIYDENPGLTREEVDQELRTKLGATRIHTFDYLTGSAGVHPEKNPLDGTGHIDMHAKLVAPCKVIVARAEASDRFHVSLEKMADDFARLECAPGRTYEVHRVRGWFKEFLTTPPGEPGSIHGIYGTWRSYTNSLIVNDTVILPGYTAEGANDEEAKRAYRAALPQHKIVVINSDAIAGTSGSIHCVTKEIPRVSATR